MSKDNRDFFKTKKVWSRVKDELLGCYLVPYFSKIIQTRRPLMYIDCFAGKGKFDDGENGSPLAALECLDRSLMLRQDNSYGAPAPEIRMYFIEKNHASDLDTNIPTAHRHRCKVVNGSFEESISPILTNALQRYGDVNLFLYIDPYGIKALNANLFLQLPGQFSSTELLINLNSVGFIREALRVRKIALRENEAELLSDLDEYDRSEMSTLHDLNTIAGGTYWQKIVDDYKVREIDFYEAEKRFSHQYKQMLRKSFMYVLDMPIRLHQGQNPKYRMVFATNHEDGCVLMADNIFKRTDFLVVDIQKKGQISLFEQNADNEPVDEVKLDRCMIDLLRKGDGTFKRHNVLQAEFFDTYGVLCAPRHLSSSPKGSSLKRLEKQKLIEVRRNPPFTSTGKVSAYWAEDGKKKTIEVRRR